MSAGLGEWTKTTDADGSKQASALPGLPTERADSRRMEGRVLIVDDEENILASLRRLFRREPYEIVTAQSADEALRLLEECPAQVVISDQRMPGVTGIELIHEVRRRWPSTLRIILSGYSEVNTILAAVNEGEIYKFISKPWNDEEIKLHVRRALELYELQEENRRMAREIMEQNEQLRALNQLLDQRATDASTGQGFALDLLEAIDVGVLAVDPSGLIVGANRRAHELILRAEMELIGVPIESVLSAELREAIVDSVATCRPVCGRQVMNAMTVQWRISPLRNSSGLRGTVVTLLEEMS